MDPISRLPSTLDQARLSGRIHQSLRQSADFNLRVQADLLASRLGGRRLGSTEFEVRDQVPKVGVKDLQTVLDEWKEAG